MQLAFVMAIGPGESEMAIDNLEAIAALYPDAQSWVRDDATTDGTWKTVQEWSKGKRVHLSRNPYPYGYRGISRSLGQLLLELVASRPQMVVKVDPDTVLLRPGLDTHFKKQFASYGNGICGSYRHSPNGHPRSFTRHRIRVLLDTLPIGPKKKQKSLRWRPVGYLRFLPAALRNGYRLGENVQGGLYAIEGSIFDRLNTSGFLHAMAYGTLGMVLEEDVLLSLGVKSVGGNISPLNESLTDAPTHIQAARPLILSREQLTSGSLLAVHPIKRVDSDLRTLLCGMRMKRLSSTQSSDIVIER